MAKLKNVTVSLPIDLIDKIKTYVLKGYLPSINACVRQSLDLYLNKLEQEYLELAMREAVQDPLFMQDLTESMRDFKDIDSENLVARNSAEW
jgi:Arc/MetJ-type ribon-helix-helix transcriptional regulator